MHRTLNFMCQLIIVSSAFSTLLTPLHASELTDEDDINLNTEVVQATSNDASSPNTEDDSQASIEPKEEVRGDLALLGSQVPVGDFDTLYWKPVQSFQSIETPVPVLVVHGKEEGPRLSLTVEIHGDYFKGIEMIRSIIYQHETTTIKGTVIGIPLVNLDGFRRGSRYLDDRRDLNRHFPGSANCSAADRIGYSLFMMLFATVNF